jgi:hypothetical protein
MSASAVMPDIEKTLKEALEPLVGSVLSQATIDIEAARLGKKPEELAADDLIPMAEAIERHLVSFVGAQLAQAAATKVREGAWKLDEG